MARVWQIQEAKNKFSEVVDEAIKHTPQIITKRGVETVKINPSGIFKIPDGYLIFLFK